MTTKDHHNRKTRSISSSNSDHLDYPLTKVESRLPNNRLLSNIDSEDIITKEDEEASPRFIGEIGKFISNLPVGITLKLSNVPDIPYHHYPSLNQNYPLDIISNRPYPIKNPVPNLSHISNNRYRPLLSADPDPRLVKNSFSLNRLGEIDPSIYPSIPPIQVNPLSHPNHRRGNSLFKDLHDLDSQIILTSLHDRKARSEACKYVSCRDMALACRSRKQTFFKVSKKLYCNFLFRKNRFYNFISSKVKSSNYSF